jgi:serine/threonine protein kinase HipA of HipAB toxin-antitoxin module
MARHRLDLSESCENEWLCLQIIEAFGLPTAKAEIQQFDGVKALVIERFDRIWSKDGRWHLEARKAIIHYNWDSIQPRHFISTARIVDFSEERAGEILEEMLQKVDVVVDRVAAMLPKEFPKHVSQPIFDGMMALAKRSLKI